MNEKKKLDAITFIVVAVTYTVFTASFLKEVWTAEPLTFLNVVTSLYSFILIITMIAFTLKTANDWHLSDSAGIIMAFVIFVSAIGGLFIDLFADVELLNRGLTLVPIIIFLMIHIMAFSIVVKVSHLLKKERELYN
ncbi:MAG: hypothetical protein WD335_03995 [Candidatus Paceibacterota bacterium]